MDILRRGAHNFKVEFLQRLLNKAAVRERVPGRPLRVDGRFGEATETALKAFQVRHRPLVNDGEAGINTWQALGLQTEHEHHIRLLGQPDGDTCWSAAASMIFGDRSVSRGRADLTAAGQLVRGVDNVGVFARSLGWQLLNHSPEVSELVGIIGRTPVWIGVEGDGWGHAVVLSGAYTDGGPSGDGTMFRIHDPWPPGRGRIYGSFADPILILGDDNRTLMPASLTSVIVPR